MGGAHVSCPYYFGVIDVGIVVDPFIQGVVLSGIANDYELLVAEIFEARLHAGALGTEVIGAIPAVSPAGGRPFWQGEMEWAGKKSQGRE